MTLRVLLAWLLAFPVAHARQADTHLLQPLDVVTRAGQSDEKHRFAIDLTEGDFVELTASQDEGAIGIAVSAPDGTAVRQINLIDLPPVDERLMLVARETGRYTIELAFERRPSEQQYTLRVLARRAATAADRDRDRCFALTAEGDRLVHVERLDSLRQGIHTFQQAAECWRSLQDRDLEVSTLTSLGGVAGLFSEFSTAGIAAYDRLASLHHASGNGQLELTSLQKLTIEYSDAGQFDRTLETAVRAHRVAVEVGNRAAEARTRHNIGLASLFLGDYRRARAFASSAADLAAEIGETTVQAFASYDLGRLDELAGDLDAAKVRYEQALAIPTPDRRVKSLLQVQLGLLHLQRAEYDEAERRFTERLQLQGVIQREQEALARIGLADVQMARGDRAKAQELYVAAGQMLARSPNVHNCIAEERLGRLDLDEERLDAATQRFARMFEIGERSGYLPCRAQAHAALADLALRRGDLEKAEQEAGQVIELNERFREAVPNLESRALGFGAIAPGFERAVHIVMERAARGDGAAAARAFELNERALARALLDQVFESTLTDPAPAVDEPASEQHRLREQWRARLAELQVVSRSPALKARASALVDEITAIELRIRDLDADAHISDARRAGLLRPSPLDLPRIQAQLDEETQLIEFALGERQSYAWLVSSKTFRAFTLAPRGEIARAAEAVHRDLATASTASTPMARERRRVLADLILGPLAAHLAAPRLVVVATGPLALIPFGALPAPGRSPVVPLVSRHEIVSVPSATTLTAMRALSARRARPEKTAMVLADPVFERDDPRVRRRQTIPTADTIRSDASIPSGPQAAKPSSRQASLELDRTFARLPFSRMEAMAISGMLPGEVTLLTDGSAARTRVVGDALANYRVVHFATHGVVHPEIASLSSIVLSTVDETGAPQDPFVRLSDIYEMRLNADVVVLSACSTAMGKDIPGEGPIGLARAFMYAGAPRVIASLWQVNDNATAELMKRFYRGMLIDRLTPAAALRRAQRQLAAIPRWASPYFWAPFVLQGDWK